MHYLLGLIIMFSLISTKGLGQDPIAMIDVRPPPFVFDVIGFHFDQKSNGCLIRVHCTKRLPDIESWLKVDGNNTWLYVTLAGAQADVAVLQEYPPTAFVRQILIFQSATSAQLTFMLKGAVRNVEIIPVEGSLDILVAIFTKSATELAIRRGRN